MVNAPGIEILRVRVTKPTIPQSIRRNFTEKEAETQKKIALMDTEKNSQVSKIRMEQMLTEKTSAKMQEEIDNQLYLAREKSLADADFYKVIKEAEANKLKLTPEFLELKFIQAIANNSKIFFGDKVSNMILDQRLLGNFLNNAGNRQMPDI
ncbi:hypothetical protein MKX01_025491 [Papaver californicum]|nr:hypothetical protein MKX01_025491 [Papaver californicum]